MLFQTPEDKKQFQKNKDDVVENLEAIQLTLQECKDEGMLDLEERFYNQLLDLIDETHLAKTKDELSEVITEAKTLEADIDAWLAMKGLNSLSMTWPEI